MVTRKTTKRKSPIAKEGMTIITLLAIKIIYSHNMCGIGRMRWFMVKENIREQ